MNGFWGLLLAFGLLYTAWQLHWARTWTLGPHWLRNFLADYGVVSMVPPRPLSVCAACPCRPGAAGLALAFPCSRSWAGSGDLREWGQWTEGVAAQGRPVRRSGCGQASRTPSRATRPRYPAGWRSPTLGGTTTSGASLQCALPPLAACAPPCDSMLLSCELLDSRLALLGHKAAHVCSAMRHLFCDCAAHGPAGGQVDCWRDCACHHHRHPLLLRCVGPSGLLRQQLQSRCLYRTLRPASRGRALSRTGLPQRPARPPMLSACAARRPQHLLPDGAAAGVQPEAAGHVPLRPGLAGAGHHRLRPGRRASAPGTPAGPLLAAPALLQ